MSGSLPLRVYALTGTSPTGTTAATITGVVQRGLQKHDYFAIDADLKGASLGTLDVYLQRKVTDDVWLDWLHFPQLAAGAARVYYSATTGGSTTITAVGKGTDASAGTPALAANSFIGGHPGDQIRMVCKAGGATNTGTGVTVYVTGWQAAR
jgi:hypothetical protein